DLTRAGAGERVGRAGCGGGHGRDPPSRAFPIALDRSVEAHLFLGDETSVASAEALTRASPPETLVLACFEVASMDHRWPDPELARPEKVRWVARAGRPGSALLSWLAGQSLSSTNSTTAYVTGEAWLARWYTRISCVAVAFPQALSVPGRTGKPSLDRRDWQSQPRMFACCIPIR